MIYVHRKCDQGICTKTSIFSEKNANQIDKLHNITETTSLKNFLFFFDPTQEKLGKLA